jgi:hypothetical protein
MEWVNTGRASKGLSLIEGHTDSWLEEKKLQVERLTLIFQGAIPYGFTGNLKAPQEVIAAA